MLKLKGRGVAREGHKVFDEQGNHVGHVTSGSLTPYLKQAVAQAYVDVAHSKVGTPLK